MGQIHLPGNPPITIFLRRSAQARRLSLRVSALDGRVTLTLPRGASLREAQRFAEEKADWLRGHVAAVEPVAQVGPGAVLPVEGVLHEIVSAPGRARIEGGRLYLPGAGAELGARAQGWLRARARERLRAASQDYAARLGREFSRITLRDTRSRWGSCSATGGLSYSWRLIMAPPEVLRYVAAHEVAHLAEMNHSPRFWARVEEIHGPYEAPRRWLRSKGAGLHRYRFAASED